MTKWAYLGAALALAAAAGVTGHLWLFASSGVMAIVAGLRLANDRRRAREMEETRQHLGHPFVAASWTEGCAHLDHPQGDRCGLPREAHHD